MMEIRCGRCTSINRTAFGRGNFWRHAIISVMNRYQVLDRARDLGLAYLRDVAGRHVGGTATQASLRAALGGPLPDDPDDPIDVIERLAAAVDPGIVASAGPRYF